jgi:hypothetical protein
MRDVNDIEAKVAALQDLLNQKFGMRKRPLPKMLQRTGRRLPKRLHVRAQVLLDAQERARHPKLARQVDMPAVGRAFDEVRSHLSAIDVADRRKGVALGIAGHVAFNVLAVAVAFVVWLWWRGYV